MQAEIVATEKCSDCGNEGRVSLPLHTVFGNLVLTADEAFAAKGWKTGDKPLCPLCVIRNREYGLC